MAAPASSLSHDPFGYLGWLIGELTVVSAVEFRCGSLRLSVDTCI